MGLGDRLTLRDRYLAALGVVARPPSVEALTVLHRAHVQRFAHDTLWVARDRVPPLEQVAMAEALVSGEGGSCAQLNLGFGWLLGELGYDVRHHRARVQMGFDPEIHPEAGHVVLTVVLDGRTWYADVGLGNGLLEPVPLEEGTLQQAGGFSYRLERSTDVEDRWRFLHDRRLMAVRVAEFDLSPADGLGVFTPGYHHVAHSPDSILRANLEAHRRLVDGVLSLSGPTLIRRGTEGRSMCHLESAAEWERVLREEFLLALPDWSTDERDRLWSKASGVRV